MGDRYGIVLDTFLEGATGQEMQRRGKDVVIVATFLIKNQWDNMIGLYEVALQRMARALPVLGSRAAVKRALDHLHALRFAYYDPDSEFIWVREMARVQMQLKGEPLEEKDLRRKGAVKLYQRLPANPFLGAFFDRYSPELGLPVRREGVSLPLLEGVSEGGSERGFEGVSQGVIVPPQTPPQVQQTGVQETDQQGTGVREQVQDTEKAAPAARRANGDDDPADNVEVITAIVQKDILPLGLADDELVEETKRHCAQLRVAYDSGSVVQAIASAQFRERLKQPLFTPLGGGPQPRRP